MLADNTKRKNYLVVERYYYSGESEVEIVPIPKDYEPKNYALDFQNRYETKFNSMVEAREYKSLIISSMLPVSNYGVDT